MNTTVTYAPQAYEYIRNCKSSADGLTISTFGNETPIDQLSEWTQEHVAEYPVRSVTQREMGQSTNKRFTVDGMEESRERSTTLSSARLLRIQVDDKESRNRGGDGR